MDEVNVMVKIKCCRSPNGRCRQQATRAAGLRKGAMQWWVRNLSVSSGPMWNYGG